MKLSLARLLFLAGTLLVIVGATTLKEAGVEHAELLAGLSAIFATVLTPSWRFDIRRLVEEALKAKRSRVPAGAGNETGDDRLNEQ